MQDAASTDPPPDPAQALIQPVYSNTFWIENALALYDGVSLHADLLNERHGLFFGLVQKFTIDSVVVGICKLFDTSNPRNRKDTVPELLVYLRENLEPRYVGRLRSSDLVDLGIPADNAQEILAQLNSASKFNIGKGRFATALDTSMPNKERSPPLNKLFLLRNKVVAHQDRVSDAVREELKFLPTFEEMEALNRWAKTFCLLLYRVLTPITMVDSVKSARMAALNVVAKVLGKTFDDTSKSVIENWSDREAFFKRLE
jgi:HEPN superfamily AbiU2-like protein